MAVNKVSIDIWDGETLTADAADSTSDTVDISTAYGAKLFMYLENGATGPTLPAEIQVQERYTKEDGNYVWVSCGGPLKAGVTNEGTYSWPMQFEDTTTAIRIVAGSNTDENVTITVGMTEAL